ncbi:MAG: methylated-DNA--[protein]-cysteine S-methyltransferase [Desulfomonilaceae bacterium]
MGEIIFEHYHADLIEQWLKFEVSEIGVTSVSFVLTPQAEVRNPTCQIAKTLISELDKYFRGSLKQFSVPLDFSNHNQFFVKVWNALLTIPYGETRSYSELAYQIGHPGAARAVGMANSRNPMALIVPCHRVIKKDKSIGGYSSGVSLKRLLLKHEGVILKA